MKHYVPPLLSLFFCVVEFLQAPPMVYGATGGRKDPFPTGWTGTVGSEPKGLYWQLLVGSYPLQEEASKTFLLTV